MTADAAPPARERAESAGLDDSAVTRTTAALEARRRRFSITVTLASALVGLVLAGVVTVLALGLWSGQQNTFDLLRDKAALTLAAATASVEQALDPARDQLLFVHDMLAFGDLDPAALDDRLVDVLSGALAATPQVGALTFITPDYRVVGVNRAGGGAARVVDERGDDLVVRRGIEAARTASGLQWGEPIWVGSYSLVAINLRLPVRRGDQLAGLLVALVSVTQLSQALADFEAEVGSRAFVLADRDHVLAHRALATGLQGLSEEQPLPTLEKVGDPVLAAIWREDASEVLAAARARRPDAPAFRAHVVAVDGEPYVYMYRELAGYGPEPWLVGTYFRAADAGNELRRLIWAAAAGTVVLILSVLAALVIGRRLAAPIVRLATAANAISDLEFEKVEPLPPSRVRELDDQARAFNAMIGGLAWFESYVPKQLVRKLMREGKAGALGFEQRPVTIMFTDIVGFTRMSEALAPAAVASFLNSHFALVGACIEAEGGTIDKFIGDSMMSFWGAPERQHDHAARACRAAQAIAREVAEENARRRERGEAAVRVRVGLHTGDAIVGNIGSPGRVNYTVVGDTVNIAQRLEQLGREVADEDDEVCVVASANTLAAAGPSIKSEALGDRRLRGRDETVAVYRLA